MFPMPALPRKTAGAFAMLLCAASAGPTAERALAQHLAKLPQTPVPLAKTAPVAPTPQSAVPQSAVPRSAVPQSAVPQSAVPQSAALPSAPSQGAAAPGASPAPLAGKASPPNTAAPPPSGSQHKAAAAKPPKPGPGVNDAGQAATALRTVKLSLVGLIDRTVTGRENREIGHVVDVLVDAKGQPSALVVDVGGFMGMGNRRIAIAWERFALAGRKPKDPLKLPLSDAEVKAAPAYDGSENVTVIQGAIEPAAAKPSHPAPAAKPSLGSSRVDLGDGLPPPPDQIQSSDQDQPADPLNPD